MSVCGISFKGNPEQQELVRLIMDNQHPIIMVTGDAGTGKSSSIKGILNRYYDEGLRIIEVYKHQFQDLNDVIAQIKNRNYKFILYMDDLSFE